MTDIKIVKIIVCSNYISLSNLSNCTCCCCVIPWFTRSRTFEWRHLVYFLYTCYYCFSFILFIIAFTCWASFWRVSLSVPIILFMVRFLVRSLICGHSSNMCCCDSFGAPHHRHVLFVCCWV